MTAERLKSTIWPHATPRSAQNSLGVAIKDVREILGRVGDLRILHEKHAFRVDLGADTTCDYFEFEHLRSNPPVAIGGIDNPACDALLAIVQSGEFLGGESFPWLDPIQSDVTTAVVSFLGDLARDAKDLSTVRNGLALLDRALRWDPLDEDLVRKKMHVLALRGRHSEVASAFRSFCEVYETEFRKPFPRPMQSFLP